MKKVIIISLLALLVLTDCGRRKHNAKSSKEERIEIVPFFRERVMLQDLHDIDTNLYLVEPEEFLSKEQYANYKSAIWSIVRNPKSKVYNWIEQKAKPEELMNRVAYCDSIRESTFDAQGNETITSYFKCDSTSVMDNLSLVYFYESWYLNTKTNLIEKETLGFTIYCYVKEKEAFKELFTVFRDETVIEKCKKYYFSE